MIRKGPFWGRGIGQRCYWELDAPGGLMRSSCSRTAMPLEGQSDATTDAVCLIRLLQVPPMGAAHLWMRQIYYCPCNFNSSD